MGQTLYLEHDKVSQFLDGIPTLKVRKMTHKQVRLMFETLFYGALRISEVLQLKPDSLMNGLIRLDVTKGGTKKCDCAIWAYRPTKLEKVDADCKRCKGTGKYRISVKAWVIREIYSELEELAKNTEPGKRLFPISRVRAWQYADSILSCRTHTFRHSFLTWMLETKKFDVRDIMQKARHKSLDTTSKYIQENTEYTASQENLNMERIT
jgi:integrase